LPDYPIIGESGGGEKMRETLFEETFQAYEDLTKNWYYECPYCGGFSQSRKNLRRHVGKIHREKVGDFTIKYRGGRTIPPHGIQELKESPRVQQRNLELPRLNVISSSVKLIDRSDGVFIKLHNKLLDYTGSLCDEAGMMCHENTARRRLAINIAKNDVQILERLVEKECKIRGWEEYYEKKSQLAHYK